MTAPPAAGEQKWWLRPRIALPVLATIIAVVALLTPQQEDARAGDQRLTTYSASPLGARLLHDLARRLGWEVERQERPGLPRDSSAIIALLAPVVPPPPEEAHAILEHVRRGGALLYVMADEGAMNDSLQLARGPGRPAEVRSEIGGTVDSTCARDDGGAIPLWMGGDMMLWGLTWRRPIPPDRVVFAETTEADEDDSPVIRRRGPPPAAARLDAAVGFAMGQGRVVVIADPDLLRNDVLRVCRWGAGVAATRMLEYLDPDRRRPVVFDEYHQGFGSHPGTFTAIGRFFARTSEGHALWQLLAAGLVLLLARAPRIVPPRDTGRIERRSPTEHVQALARAYEKVGATRTSVLRLLQGLRRRVARLGPPAVSESGGADALLDWAQRRAPATAADVAVVRQALDRRISSRDLGTVGEALRNIESELTRPPGATTASRADARAVSSPST